MSTELIVSTATLAVRVTEGLEKANDLLKQAGRAEIAERKDYENGTDFRKIVSGVRKRLEDWRKELVDPYGKRVRYINAEIKRVRDVLDKGDSIVQTKMLKWHSDEQQRQREENERLRKEAEDAALAAAEEAEEAGEAAQSEAILNMASEVPKAEDKPATGRGELTGAASVASTVWTAHVHNVKHACQAIADGHLPEDLVTFSQSRLNVLARGRHEKSPDAEEIAQYGITAKSETRLSVR